MEEQRTEREEISDIIESIEESEQVTELTDSQKVRLRDRAEQMRQRAIDRADDPRIKARRERVIRRRDLDALIAGISEDSINNEDVIYQISKQADLSVEQVKEILDQNNLM